MTKIVPPNLLIDNAKPAASYQKTRIFCQHDDHEHIYFSIVQIKSRIQYDINENISYSWGIYITHCDTPAPQICQFCLYVSKMSVHICSTWSDDILRGNVFLHSKSGISKTLIKLKQNGDSVKPKFNKIHEKHEIQLLWILDRKRRQTSKHKLNHRKTHKIEQPN